MSLWPMKKIEPAFEYNEPFILMPCENRYSRETWKVTGLGGWSTGTFVFKPDEDRFYLLVTMGEEYCNQAFYPHLQDVQRQVLFYFDAETLELVGRDDETGGLQGPWGLIGLNFTGSVTTGSYDRMYMTNIWLPEIIEFGPDGTRTGWTQRYGDLPECPNTIVGPTAAIVNRADNILVVAGFYSNGNEIHFWKDFETASPVHTGVIRIPSKTIFNLAWESRRYFWVIWEGGGLAKIDMQLRRVELYSRINFVTGVDVRVFIGWDTNRGRLIIMRHSYDEGYPTPLGDARNSIEAYRPIPIPAILTKPVPVAPLRTNKTIPFTFHLLGDGGEGITPYTVNVALTAPVDGGLARHSVQVGGYGWGTINYYSPDIACVETLTLESEITEVPVI